MRQLCVRRGLRCLCIGLLLGGSAWAHAAFNLADPVPVGPQVQKGQLANGLTYYIQKNTLPEKRLELRLVVKAGSVLEDEDQRGLAHFVEHMAFNGSTHFKKHELVSYLQSIGLKFGADLNAYTSFNETVYILPLPTDRLEAVEKGFLVLADWAGGVRFADADIDLERGIVLEELRLGKGAQDRMNKVLLPQILGGSRYADRLPIGTQASITGAPYGALKRFYQDWYRPDLMAVVVVGDIEPGDARELIEANFAPLKNPENARPRTYPVLPVRTVSEAVVVTDKEATNTVMQMLYPVMADQPVLTFADMRQQMLSILFGQALGQRIQALTQQASPPFVGGVSGFAPLMPGYRMFSSSAVLGRQGAQPAISALVQENERARQFGFSADELARGQKNLLRRLEQAFAEREKTPSAQHAAQYIRHFLRQEAIPGSANELAYAREMLPTITVADLNNFARSTIPEQAAKLVIYAGTDKAEANTPLGPQLLAAVQDAEQIKVTAKVEKSTPTRLMATLPQAGSITAERRNEVLDLTELVLSNGVKVILKSTDFKSDQIQMAAARFGGQSLAPEADKFNAAHANAVMGSMGVGNFTPLELQRMLAGKVVSVNASLRELTDSLGGASSNADLETFFQLLHLKFGAARRDENLFKSFVTRSQDATQHALAQPEAIYRDALQSTLYAHHPRVLLTPRPEDFAQLDLARLQSLYEQRFASAKGFTFVFVGSFNLEEIKPLLATYVASLPTPDLPTQFVDLGIRPVSGVVKKEVLAGSEAKAQVSLVFAGAAPYSEKDQLRVRAMVDVINIKIIDVLREQLTLIYGGSLSGGLKRQPYPGYHLTLSLPCGPENIDQVIAAAWGEIKKIQDAGPEAADLDKVKQNWRLAHRKSLRENGYWLGLLSNAALVGNDPARVLRYEQDVAAITPGDVQAMARRYLREDNYLQMTLKPELTAGK